jgi:hypothetical protein
MHYFAILPEEFAHFATWMFVSALTMSNVISELTIIDLAVCPFEFTAAMLQIVVILSDKLVAVEGCPHSSALSFSFDETSFIDASIFPFVKTKTMKFSLEKLTRVCVSIDEFFISLSLFQSLVNFTNIIKSVFGDHFTFT